MQQTEKYKLNLIEKTDTFSPDALNQNTQKVENALAAATAHADAGDAAVTAAFQAGDAALDGRVTALELHKVFAGTYIGDGTDYRFINLGFTPTLVLLTRSGGAIFAWDGWYINQNNYYALEVVEGGFRVGTYMQMNTKNQKYVYVVFR